MEDYTKMLVIKVECEETTSDHYYDYHIHDDYLLALFKKSKYAFMLKDTYKEAGIDAPGVLNG